MNQEARAVLEAKKVPALLPAPGTEDENGVRAPARGTMGRLRARANRAFAETTGAEANGHGNGHHAEQTGAHVLADPAHKGRAAAGAAGPAQPAPARNRGDGLPGP